ncbi:hypothetical protein ASC61_08015 [Aeromicrobium sp. Root344]|uniref:hypothetical protein n=1 Tax=Aeromicrobium sp. Root344 TaxID=1736521 RepID=UPI0006F5A874|nr:hypothetical protein [Aeromicrobium sp. Root344]KQV74947.1 hypothetical protein ASC61_08015 [Aeromicrobium sp. Root344]
MASVAVLALLLGVSACGSDDDKADPKPTKTTASPTPTTPVQPKGADGVTYEIQNWDAYADDPAVLAWKQAVEGVAGSTNARKVLPSMRQGLSKSVLRTYVASIKQAWKGDWHVDKVGDAKVQSVRTSGNQARMVVCVWNPTTVYYDKNNKPIGDPSRAELSTWARQKVTMRLTGGHWIMTAFKYSGKCPGGAPA